MPSDIRSFFGGKPAAAEEKEPAKKPAKKGGRSRKTLDDSDDEVTVKKATPKKASTKKREPTPEGEDQDASEYFGKSKPKRSAPSKAAPVKKEEVATPKASPAKNGTTKGTGRTSTRKKAGVNYAEDEQVKTEKADVKEEDDDEDVVPVKSNGRSKRTNADIDEDDDDVKPTRVSGRKSAQTKIKEEDDFDPDGEDIDMKDVEPEDDFLVPDEDEHIEVDKPATVTKSKGTAARKRKSTELEDDDEEEDEEAVKPKKSRAAKTSTPKKPAAKKVKAADIPEDSAAQAIFDSIPLVRPPTPPPRDGESKKFDFRAGNANSGPPPGGALELPEGAENCLAGLTFVFTGLLSHLGRDEGHALVKRYGGKIVGAPSGKTSYVVLGSDAGPKKLEVIAKNNLKTINEEGLFELIRRLPANGGSSKAAAQNEEKKDKEMAKIKEMAALAEKEERAAAKASASAPPQGRAAKDAAPTSGPDTRLWTVKHAPSQLAQICGNKAQVEKLTSWLRAFPKNLDKGFKLGGPDGSGIFRAVMIHGPPGIGKTTAAHLVAKLEGYDIVESNASDTRSKKLVETGLKGVLDTTSLLGYFAGDGQQVATNKRKLCLILDEVDGMSAGDRGGVGALAAVCRKSKVPMILICNERKLPKMKPFDTCTYALPFRRPTTEQIRSRIMTIMFREGMKLPGNIIDALIEGTGADIRQIVNMVSTVKLDSQAEDAAAMDFDRSKQMSKAWEKSVILRPWDIVSKILGGGMFAQTSKASLNDKIELYFNDHEFAYLMLAENYLGTNPIAASNYRGREQALKKLELADKAANSISEGDLVDRMIHGPEQQWSLMPTHAIMSFVRPASFVSGSMAGHGTAFPQWFGKNSTQGKLTRMVKEIQGHMRLRASGDRHEIRQQYVPSLWAQMIRKLEHEGKDAVPEVIELMDSYFLTKDDWDAVIELGVGSMDQDKVKIESQTKATFTRLYNAQSHPLPFMKAGAPGATKAPAKVKPDLEEALEESDEGELAVDDAAAEDDDDDLGGDLAKDKYVKAPKKKKAAPAAKGKAAAKGKGKRKADEDDDEDEDEDEKPAKKAKGKGKAKK